MLIRESSVNRLNVIRKTLFIKIEMLAKMLVYSEINKKMLVYSEINKKKKKKKKKKRKTTVNCRQIRLCQCFIIKETDTVFTLSIWTPKFLTILVLKFE